MRDCKSKCVFAHVVLGKFIVGSRKGRYVVGRVVDDVKQLGHNKVVLFGDQEPAIKALHDEVKKKREAETICLNSPVESSASNGKVEGAVQEIRRPGSPGQGV